MLEDMSINRSREERNKNPNNMHSSNKNEDGSRSHIIVQ
jgi:hypothetical protein